MASIERPETISAIVYRGGRSDLADRILPEVKPPTLLIVGSRDTTVLEKNQISFKKLTCEKRMIIIQGATHLFEEKGKLKEVADHAIKWFQEYLNPEELNYGINGHKSSVNSYFVAGKKVKLSDN